MPLPPLLLPPAPVPLPLASPFADDAECVVLGALSPTPSPEVSLPLSLPLLLTADAITLERFIFAETLLVVPLLGL